MNPNQRLTATLIPENAMRTTGRAGETGSGVTWNIGNYQSTGTEDNIAKVTGDGGLLTFKNLGKTRVYVTTNSPGYYTYREVSVLNDEITESGIQITIENIYGTTPRYKSKPASMQTEVPEYSFNIPYEETVFNFGVHGLNETARVDPKHATLRHMSTYSTDNSGVIIANSVIDTTFPVTVTAEYGNTFTWRIKLHRENRNPTLKNINVAGHTLVPAFSPNCYYYECPVKSKTADLNIRATALIYNTKVFGTGDYKGLRLGDTIINITSQSEDGKMENTYTVHVYNPTDADLQLLTVGKGELIPEFDPLTTEYEVCFSEFTPDFAINAKTASTKATLLNPEKVNLETGKTAFKVTALSYDKTVSKDYTVIADNPKRGDTDLLEEITVSVPNTALAPNTVFIDGEFIISAKCTPASTLKGTGTFKAGSLPGDATFIIKVTAENRTVKEYPVTVHVVYPFGDGWRLSADTLYADNRDRSKHILRYDQSPRYGYRKYIKHVAFSDDLTVIAPLMLYGCNQITELHLPLRLKEIGDNAFTGCDNLGEIILTSQTPPKANNCSFLNSQGRHMGNQTVLRVHGESHAAYTNACYRRGFTTVKTIENDDATLKSLSVRHLNLTPAFSRDIFEYSVIVTDDPHSVIIDAESADPVAQVSGQGVFKSVAFEDTVFKVGVTAANHADKKEYRINIRKV